MKALHVLTGLPRSGSTLLQNILNQNPDFMATSTSPLVYMVNCITNTASNAIEFKAALQADREAAESRLVNSTKAFIEAWCNTDKVVIDKSRVWASSALSLNQLYPNAKLIIMVRDLRAVFASIEKQHRKSPILDDSTSVQARAIYDRADKMFSPEGLIGMPIIGIEDLIRRNIKNVIWVQYKYFVRNPKMVMAGIYAELGETLYTHDFDNVVNTADDPDGFYLWKFPHTGSGQVREDLTDEWKQYISDDLAITIMQRFGFFNNHFGYK